MISRPDADDVEVQHGAIEADAVCAQCGTVNPEGTLLCKACGTNLREQRERRLVDAQLAEAAALAPKRTGVVSKVLTVFGFLLVLWVAVNISTIEGFLERAQLPSQSMGHLFWTGPTAGGYDALQRALEANPVTDEEIVLATSEPDKSGILSGKFVVFGVDQDLTSSPMGYALVRQVSNEKLEFSADFGRNMDARGDIWIETGGRPAARESAAVRIGGEYHVAFGFAGADEEGGWTCVVGTDKDETYVEAKVYHIPGSESAVPPAE